MATDFNSLLQQMMGGGSGVGGAPVYSGPTAQNFREVNGMYTPLSDASSRVGGPTAGQAGGTPGLTTNLEQQTVTNMDPASMAALQTLISQLLGGGTAEMKEQRANRNQEIVSNRDLRSGFTSDMAQVDSKQAVEATTRQAMEQALGQLARAVMGAGTSQNSMRALLTQNAQRDAAESAAKLGLDTKVQYGNLASQFSGVLEALTRPNDAVTTALLQALDTAKGVNPTTQTMSFTQAPAPKMSGGVSRGGGSSSQSISQAFPEKSGGLQGGGNLSFFGDPGPSNFFGGGSASLAGAGTGLNMQGDSAGLWNTSAWGVR